MAKKSSQRRRALTDGRPAFDDSAYDNLLVSATFEPTELGLSRAAELMGPRLRANLTAGTFASLAVLVLVALAVGNQSYPLLIALFLVSLGFLYASSNVGRLRLRYARSTTLDPAGFQGSVHVAVCEDAVHVRDEGGAGWDYPLSELKVVNGNAEGVLAGFGQKRYVYVPRNALSEGRFRELVRFLEER